jgi:hypothetical protein
MEPIKLSNIGGVTTNITNPTESTKLGTESGTETQGNTLNGSAGISEQLENTKETEAESRTGKTVKHVVTYIGNGNWIDGVNEKWARQTVAGTGIMNSREYTDVEYQTREDLKFMISYGAMTVVTVTL